MEKQLTEILHKLANWLTTTYGSVGNETIDIRLPYKMWQQLQHATSLAGYSPSDKLVLWSSANLEITGKPKPIPPKRKADCCCSCTSFSQVTSRCSLRGGELMWADDTCDAFERRA